MRDYVRTSPHTFDIATKEDHKLQTLDRLARSLNVVESVTRLPAQEVVDLNQSERISIGSVGQFDSKNWLKEGDGLLASSVKTREIWITHDQKMLQNVQGGKLEGGNHASDWHLLEGLPRASMLLLGYSIEMYLKAGLAKAYQGCSERMFKRDIMQYGHNFVRLAKDISFALRKGDGKNLDCLRKMVLTDARYPIFVVSGETLNDEINQQTGRIWSHVNFQAFTELANRVNDHARSIDADRNNPSFCRSIVVDDDGYLTFRQGGNLPPRVTYGLSAVQKSTGRTSFDDIKAIFLSAFPVQYSMWEHAWIYEDGEDKTVCHAQP